MNNLSFLNSYSQLITMPMKRAAFVSVYILFFYFISTPYILASVCNMSCDMCSSSMLQMTPHGIFHVHLLSRIRNVLLRMAMHSLLLLNFHHLKSRTFNIYHFSLYLLT